MAGESSCRKVGPLWSLGSSLYPTPWEGGCLQFLLSYSCAIKIAMVLRKIAYFQSHNKKILNQSKNRYINYKFTSCYGVSWHLYSTYISGIDWDEMAMASIYTAIRFVSNSAKFCICIVVGLNG